MIGIPTDGAQVFRSGSRFGPEAIRSASMMLRNYNPNTRHSDACERLSLVDYGDVATVPGSTADSLERSAAGIAEAVSAGAATLCLGGDHSVSSRSYVPWPSSRPLALVQLDAHHDLWDEYFGEKLFHGSVVRRVAEELSPTFARSRPRLPRLRLRRGLAPYDPCDVTAFVAANAWFEMLSLLAVQS